MGNSGRMNGGELALLAFSDWLVANDEFRSTNDERMAKAL
jgi:hypothetical protein